MTSIKVFYSKHPHVTILDVDQDNFILQYKDQNRYTIQFNECGHTKQLKANSLITNGPTNCTHSNCRAFRFNPHIDYRRDRQLDLNTENYTITCLDCNRVYNRCKETFRKDLNKFTCYCKLLRPDECRMYDLLKGRFPGLVKSFKDYAGRKNYSSDFHLKHNDIVFVFHSNGESHRKIDTQTRDCKKLFLCKHRKCVDVFIEQDYIFAHPEEALNQIDEIVYRDYDFEDPLQTRTDTTFFIEFPQSEMHKFQRGFLLYMIPGERQYNSIYEDVCIELNNERMRAKLAPK